MTSTTSTERLIAGLAGYPGWKWDEKTGHQGQSDTGLVWRLDDGRWAWSCRSHQNNGAMGIEPSRLLAMAATEGRGCFECARERAEAFQ